jgi:hypothetical protein
MRLFGLAYEGLARDQIGSSQEEEGAGMSKRWLLGLGGVVAIAVGCLAFFVVAPMVGLRGEDAPSAAQFSNSSPTALSDGRTELERCIADWEEWRVGQAAEYEVAVLETSPSLDQGMGEVAVLRFSGGECGVTVSQDPSLETFGFATLIDRGAGFESFADTKYGRVPVASVLPQVQEIGEIGQQFVNAYLGPGYALSPLDGAGIIPVGVSGEIKGIEGLGDSVPKDRIAYAIDAEGFSRLTDSQFISAVSQFAIDYREECPKTAIVEIGSRYRDGDLEPSTWPSPSLQVTLRDICSETVERMEAAEERLNSALSARGKEWNGFSEAFKARVAEKYLDEYGCPLTDRYGGEVSPEEMAFYTTKYLKNPGYYSGWSGADASDAMEFWCDDSVG